MVDKGDFYEGSLNEAAPPYKKEANETAFAKLTPEEQEDFDQSIMNVDQLLAFDSNKTYIVENLNIENHLNRALRLLYRVRFERNKVNIRISSYIKYDLLPLSIVNIIKAKTAVERAQQGVD